MKRFYKAASSRPTGGGFEIMLDERPVKTPARAPLILPEPLAEAIVWEWAGQSEEIDPRSMPLTGLANAAIDRVAPDREAFAKGLTAYGESDLLCYRAEAPDSLVERQAKHWDPLLAWARRRFDVDFSIVSGVIHRPQPQATLRQLEYTVAARTPFELAGLSPLVTIGGSLIIALALAEGAVELEQAWDAATLDETWQAERWGADEEALKALEARRREFAAGHYFLTLLGHASAAK